VVVVGAGMVAHRFALRLRELDITQRYRIVVFGEEPHAPYDRANLSRYFRLVHSDGLALAAPSDYQARSIELHVAQQVVALERTRRLVGLADGATLGYSKLVLATGARTALPALRGLNRPGVFTYRTRGDLEAIQRYRVHADRAAVLGGGLLGLEAAHTLQQLGLETRVFEAAAQLMPHELDAPAALLLRQQLEAAGLQIQLDCAPKAVLGETRCAALRIDDNATVPVEMVIVATGTHARDELAQLSQLRVGDAGGIVVDDALRTSDPHIFAIGECALHRGVSHGRIAAGYAMAEVVARQLCGQAATFEGADRSAKLNVVGVEVAVFGDPQPTDPNAKEVVLQDRVKNVYKRLLVSADARRLLGGILVGDTSDHAALTALVADPRPLSVNPAQLLFGKALRAEAAATGDGHPLCERDHAVPPGTEL
jgi:nitrite reductase (NADH) large subunit